VDDAFAKINGGLRHFGCAAMSDHCASSRAAIARETRRICEGEGASTLLARSDPAARYDPETGALLERLEDRSGRAYIRRRKTFGEFVVHGFEQFPGVAPSILSHSQSGKAQGCSELP